MDDKKVLVICRYFVPYSENIGWSLRVLKLCGYLSETGHNVHLLAASEKEEYGYFGYKEALEAFETHYVGHFRNFLRSREGKKDEPPQKSAHFLPKIGSFLEILADEISTPDLFVWFIWKFYRKAKELIEREKIKDVIISTPPHSLQIVGLLLKRHFKDRINLTADYRDSWNSRSIFRKNIPLLQAINSHLERLVLDNVDHLTYVSLPIMDKIAIRYGEKLRAKGTLIMNGFDPKSLPKEEEITRRDFEKNEVRIGYFGSLHRKWVNPIGFAETLAGIINSRNDLLNDVKLEFYSTIDEGLKDTIKEMLGGRVVFRKTVDHREAVRLMQKMDYLALFYSETDGADEIMTGKFFDYLSCRKPIIVWGPKGMEVSRIVEENRIGAALDREDENRNIEILTDILNGGKGYGSGYSSLDLNRFASGPQFSKFLNILSS